MRHSLRTDVVGHDLTVKRAQSKNRCSRAPSYSEMGHSLRTGSHFNNIANPTVVTKHTQVIWHTSIIGHKHTLHNKAPFCLRGQEKGNTTFSLLE
jgi:hypothetical protein